MAPNLFVCLRNVFCPVYWFRRSERIEGSLHGIVEHWDDPVPGTYKYMPCRGWFLVHRDGKEEPEKVPTRLVYCRILHQYLFESDMEERCVWQSITRREGEKPEEFLFFRLDDGFSWVAGWDAKGRFIPGPYKKWYIDPDTSVMRRMKSSGNSTPNTSRSNSIVPEKM